MRMPKLLRRLFRRRVSYCRDDVQFVYDMGQPETLRCECGACKGARVPQGFVEVDETGTGVVVGGALMERLLTGELDAAARKWVLDHIEFHD